MELFIKPRPSHKMLRERIMQRARRRRHAAAVVSWIIAAGYVLAGTVVATFALIALAYLFSGLIL
jgi:hypothetical protein